MLVVDSKRSEIGPQRRRAGGRLLHCCCICGKLDVWSSCWSGYYSEREMDDEVPIPKFCSQSCAERAGPEAQNVTDEMKRKAKDAEFREPELGWRKQTDHEKYAVAAYRQRRPPA